MLQQQIEYYVMMSFIFHSNSKLPRLGTQTELGIWLWWRVTKGRKGLKKAEVKLRSCYASVDLHVRQMSMGVVWGRSCGHLSVTFSKLQCTETIEETWKQKSIFTSSENINEAVLLWNRCDRNYTVEFITTKRLYFLGTSSHFFSFFLLISKTRRSQSDTSALGTSRQQIRQQSGRRGGGEARRE